MAKNSLSEGDEKITLLNKLKSLRVEINKLEKLGEKLTLDQEIALTQLESKYNKILRIQRQRIDSMYAEKEAVLENNIAQANGIIDIKKLSPLYRSLADEQLKAFDILFKNTRLESQSNLTTQQKLDIQSDLFDEFDKLRILQNRLAQSAPDELAQQELLRNQYESQNYAIEKRILALKDADDISKETADTIASTLTSYNQVRGVAAKYATIQDDVKEQLESQIQAYDKIKKAILGVINTGKVLFSNPKALFGSAIIAAGVLADRIGDVGSELGFTIREINNATLAAGALSIFFDDTAGTVRRLTHEFGTMDAATFQAQLNVGLMSKTMGVSNTEAVRLVGMFARLNGGSRVMAENLIKSTKEFAKQNKVIPSVVFAELAANAEAVAVYGKQGGVNMAKAAVEAARIGTSLEATAGIADTLLDFETSITNELELGAMLGRNITLGKARQLAYDGEIAEMTTEVLKQLGGRDAWNKMDIFQKREAAKLLGIQADELGRMIENQEQLAPTTSFIATKFNAWSEAADAVSTKYLGTGLKALGGWVIAMGQFGTGAKTAFDTVKGLGGFFKKMFGAGGSIASTTSTLGDVFTGPRGGKYMVDPAGKKKYLDRGTSASKGFAGGGIVDSFNKINMGSAIKGAIALTIVAGALWVFGKAVQEFQGLAAGTFESLAQGLVLVFASMAILGAMMSSPIGAGILIGAGVILVFAGALWVLGKAVQEVAAGFSALGNVSAILTGLVSMVSGIGQLALAFGGLSASLLLLGSTGMIALPTLNGIGIAGEGIAKVADLFGYGKDAEPVTAVEDGSLNKYHSEMLSKMNTLIDAVNKNRDVYLDAEKVSVVVKTRLERNMKNDFNSLLN